MKPNIEKYYENTKDTLPNPIVQRFIKMNVKPTNAIDFGCGAGRDSVFLIKNGWKVLGIDREDVEEIISQKLTQEEKKNFRFERADFENVQLEKNNLLVASFSIPFCNEKIFGEVWNKIKDSILKERIFCRKFFRFK
jgi:ubiquinone/menaquinone biosynthesis C-methylase UbiE